MFIHVFIPFLQVMERKVKGEGTQTGKNDVSSFCRGRKQRPWCTIKIPQARKRDTPFSMKGLGADVKLK